jgi:hypothetical protein
MEEKVVQLLNELPIKEEKDRDAFKQLRILVEKNDAAVNERIDTLIKENFTVPESSVPDVGGNKDTKDNKNKLSFRDYMTNNMTSMASSI